MDLIYKGDEKIFQLSSPKRENFHSELTKILENQPNRPVTTIRTTRNRNLIQLNSKIDHNTAQRPFQLSTNPTSTQNYKNNLKITQEFFSQRIQSRNSNRSTRNQTVMSPQQRQQENDYKSNISMSISYSTKNKHSKRNNLAQLNQQSIKAPASERDNTSNQNNNDNQSTLGSIKNDDIIDYLSILNQTIDISTKNHSFRHRLCKSIVTRDQNQTNITNVNLDTQQESTMQSISLYTKSYLNDTINSTLLRTINKNKNELRNQQHIKEYCTFESNPLIRYTHQIKPKPGQFIIEEDSQKNGGQVAALQYALNHNQLQKSLGNTHQTFNFNLQGGKLNQNCLYLAIQQNNIKIITTLIFSDEQLNFLQVDDEGRLPKDICPYNSPVYKLLVQYELKHVQSAYNQVQRQQNQINGKQQDVVQYYFNKRHYESPNKIRERILERAQTENQKSKRKQNNHSAFRGRSVVNTCKNNNQQQREGLFTETKGFSNANRKHSRVMSQYHRSSMDRIRYLDDQNSSLLQDEAEFSRFDRRSPLSGKMSANFSPSMTPLLQKEVSLDFIICDDNLNIQQENKQTNRHNQIKIQSIISSVDSQLTRTLLVNNFRQSVQVNQKDLQFESPMQSQSNIFQSQKKKQPCQTIQNQNAEAHQINIQEAVQVEEDDDANVPEEEIDDNQDFQKPQMRQFAKSPSQKAFYGGGSDSYQVDTLKLTKIILDQVETWRKKSISYNRFSINPQSIIIGEDYKTIPTQELIYCLSQPNFHSNSNQVLSDEQNIQQQLSEMSQIYQVLDESNIGIQPPGDSTNKNPKLCVNLLQQTTQKCNIMQISKQQNHQYIQEFYILISKGLIEQSLKFIEKQINKKNCLIITDLCYMLGNILDKKDMLSQLNNYYCISDLDQMCSRRFNDFVLFELINRFSQRLFDEKHKTKFIFILLYNQKSRLSMKANVNQTYSTINTNYKEVNITLLETQSRDLHQ